MTGGFTDIHHHLVYGMDDGPRSLGESRAMLRAAKEDGIRRIVVTPHAMPGIERFDYALYLQRLDELAGYAWNEGITLLPGAEILFTEATRRHLDDGLVPTLAGTQHVLIEFSPDIEYGAMERALESLLVGGYLPILAHIERYHCFVSQLKRAVELKKQLDVRFQVNCATMVRGKGFAVNRFCRKLFEERLIDAVATDAHNVGSRPVMMAETYRVLEAKYGARYARYLSGISGGMLA